jgi:hypothetical protein
VTASGPAASGTVPAVRRPRRTGLPLCPVSSVIRRSGLLRAPAHGLPRVECPVAVDSGARRGPGLAAASTARTSLLFKTGYFRRIIGCLIPVALQSGCNEGGLIP